jgi:hypothetical protein
MQTIVHQWRLDIWYCAYVRLCVWVTGWSVVTLRHCVWSLEIVLLKVEKASWRVSCFHLNLVDWSQMMRLILPVLLLRNSRASPWKLWTWWLFEGPLVPCPVWSHPISSPKPNLTKSQVPSKVQHPQIAIGYLTNQTAISMNVSMWASPTLYYPLPDSILP